MVLLEMFICTEGDVNVCPFAGVIEDFRSFHVPNPRRAPLVVNVSLIDAPALIVITDEFPSGSIDPSIFASYAWTARLLEYGS